MLLMGMVEGTLATIGLAKLEIIRAVVFEYYSKQFMNFEFKSDSLRKKLKDVLRN